MTNRRKSNVITCHSCYLSNGEHGATENTFETKILHHLNYIN